MIRKIIISALLVFNVTGCIHTEKKIWESDITSEGFLSDSVFQVLVKSQPDKNAKGLVNQRESAYITAKSKITEAASSALLEYWTRHNEKNSGAKDLMAQKREHAKSVINVKYKKITESGKIAHEYYRENGSVVLVYRIEKSRLRMDIESIDISKTEEKTVQNSGGLKK